MLRVPMTQHSAGAPWKARRIDADACMHVRDATSMRTASRFVSMALLLAILTRAHVARSEAFDINDSTWEGCSALYDVATTEIGMDRVKAVAVLDWSTVTLNDGVLVLHPLQSMDPEETEAFVRAGGRLAIIDDYGRGEETLRRFSIERTTLPTRPLEALRNKPQLAIAKPVLVDDKGQATGPHPVVVNVQQFVTNHATGLRSSKKLTSVLEIPAVGEPPATVALAGMVDAGRVFALGDPSGLMNQMLRYPGNRAFAAALCHYLVDEDGGKRHGGKLYIVTNRFSEVNSFAGNDSLRKDLESYARNFADALAEARQHGAPGALHWAIALFSLLGIGAWILRAAARPYKSPNPRFARPTPLVAQGGVAGRFALLSAPSSPPSLVLLELKSALVEALGQKLGTTVESSTEGIFSAAHRAAKLDDAQSSALKDVLSAMQKAEASIVAGRPTYVPRAMRSKAARIVGEVLHSAGGITPAPLGDESRSMSRSTRPPANSLDKPSTVPPAPSPEESPP